MLFSASCLGTTVRGFDAQAGHVSFARQTRALDFALNYALISVPCLQQINFSRSSDALYKLHIVNISDKVVLWKSMEDILSKAITSILINLQHQYANDPNALLYFCISQAHLIGGIRSAVHSLNFNRPDTMVKQFMSDFYHYINSNADVKLDSTFECYFHVVSSKTLSKPGHRRTAIPIRSLVGSRDPDCKTILKGSLINLPPGSPKNPYCFTNTCLLVTVVFMIIKKFKKELYSDVRNLILVKSKNSTKNVAADILLDEMKLVCTKTKLNFNGPHELRPTLKILSDHYRANLIVISSLEGFKPEILSYPENFDESMPRLYFALQLNDGQPNHVLAIDNLSTYFKSHKRAICFKCQNFYYLTWGIGTNRHKCHHPEACRKCFGFSYNNSTVKDEAEPWWYCDTFSDDSITNLSDQTCSKCGVTFKSAMCFENHHKYFCKKNCYYYQCPCCQKSISMRRRPLEQVQAEHICNVDDKFCTVCNRVLPLTHICAVSKKEKDKIWPNIAVLSITFEDAVGSMCQLCYLKQSRCMSDHNMTYSKFFQSKLYHESLCDAHKNHKTSDSNIIKIFYEIDRFSFTSRTFSNDDFLASATNLNETLLCTYSSAFLPKASTLANSRTYKTTTNLKLASSQLLHFLKSVNLAHYSFVVHTNREMLWLLDLFLSDFLNPMAVQTGRVVKKITLPSLKIDFLLFENYCKGSLHELSQQFNLGRSTLYFPMVYNQSQYYGQVIKLPSFETFLTFNDTPKEVELKQKYYGQLSTQYDINAELYKVVTENLKTLLLSVIKFLDSSFQVEGYLAEISGSNEPSACHPFGKNVMSLSAFSMAIFKYYFYNSFDTCSVDKPYTGFYSKVSAPEYEYLSFLSFTKPEENILHAFNRREGQMRFDNVIVDGYSPVNKTVYQFHGCMVNK